MSNTRREHLRELPSIDSCLAHPMAQSLLLAYSKQQVTSALRSAMDRVRHRLLQGELDLLSRAELMDIAMAEARAILVKQGCGTMQRVVNATGIILHTNLGRAVLPQAAIEALATIAGGYCDLELDLASGARGSRQTHVEKMLTELTGAEAALVVNNNAAAVFLCLNTFADGREVVVSRGEQVEIGGSFRIPDVIRQSGATLVEVGTTNRTYLSDYVDGIGESTAVLLKVHRSNFRLVGFVASVSPKELAALASSRALLSMEDVGSGSLIDLAGFGVRGEPTVKDSINAGIDLVTFSGDKLLGGPQAGIIVGRRHLVQKLQGNPLARILRIDKLRLAALEALLGLYTEPQHLVEVVPALQMLALAECALETRARELASLIADSVVGHGGVSIIDAEGEMGGGTLPGLKLPGKAVAVRPHRQSVHQVQASLRLVGIEHPDRHLLPIIAPVENDQVVFHLRTLLPGDEVAIAGALAAAMGGQPI
ncbi:MAG: L-seryl-tRNA(Sec) selenium transferase [Firmicutes bacterium]|nr:L-seryl-tRNA(Sec) selenium transferase [Bacillota bacterium]